MTTYEEGVCCIEVTEVVLIGEVTSLGPYLLLQVREHLVDVELRGIEEGDDELGDGGGGHLGDKTPVEIQQWNVDNVLHDIFIVKFGKVFSHGRWHIVILQQLSWLGK